MNNDSILQPNENSLLFDMDSTLLNMEYIWVARMNMQYPDIKTIEYYPMTEILHKVKNVVCAQISQEAVYNPRFYADEQFYIKPIELVKTLLQQNEDIWFVTGIPQNYQEQMGIQEKYAQIQRIFGIKYKSKIIFTFNKFTIPGKYLIDDHPNLMKDQTHAIWKGIFVNWPYNINTNCERRVTLNNMSQDLMQVFKNDQYNNSLTADIKQTQSID